jgi:hypothetical protein
MKAGIAGKRAVVFTSNMQRDEKVSRRLRPLRVAIEKAIDAVSV